jgi:hypothetical protein
MLRDTVPRRGYRIEGAGCTFVWAVSGAKSQICYLEVYRGPLKPAATECYCPDERERYSRTGN